VLSYPMADALVAQTPAAAQRYVEQLRLLKWVEVVPNPLPHELSSSAARSQHDGRGGCVIAMGRLTPQKGFDRLIKAFAQALGEDPSWSLHIWGEGPLRAELTRLIAELHLTNRVHLKGATNKPWEALAGAQIFVLSSAYEGFPNAMLEAMAVGLPCVAFDCPSGPRELSDEGLAALMVAPGDVSGLAGAIRELALAREARRELGARAAAFVRSKFSEEAVLGNWDRVFERVTAARRQAR
jgi:GalNAc-alpha-(1->4)-GalNAc-alpha-(1->3)-diNAcBac-PP-undecaprenol alpha-1,4-N-acetyl-D-galactosaminyltransferase